VKKKRLTVKHLLQPNQAVSGKRVCMFVYNNFTNDSRVQKEAETLIQAGYPVTVLALLDSKTMPEEERNDIRIFRVQPIPWHIDCMRRLQCWANSQPPPSTPAPSKKSNFAFLMNGIFFLIGKGKALKLVPRAIIPMSMGRYVAYFLKTIAYAVLLIGVVELFTSPMVQSIMAEHKLPIYAAILVGLSTRTLLLSYSTPLRHGVSSAARRIRHGVSSAARRIRHGVSSAARRIRHGVSSAARRIRHGVSSAARQALLPFHRQFCFWAFYRAAYPATANQGFTVYHAHDLNTLPVAWLAARRDKAELVYDSHELYVERNKLNPSSKAWKWFQRKVEGFLIRRCDAVFTVNESLAGEMAKRYNIAMPGVIMNTPAKFTKADLALLGNGRLRSELNIPVERKLLLYVGAITFNRGLEELIQSLRHLPDCFLVFMGYGNAKFKQGLAGHAEQTGVSDRFSFFGPVPTDRVIHYAAGADLGVAPIANACLSYYYCSPNKLFEYMNAGLPVIASNFPELEKVVLGHHIGLTFDPADPQDIARAARRILDDPELATLMRQNALSTAGRYNWGNEAEKLVGIYGRLK
jgi:glycosyltransferase involved in cell wall biosynthesis